ncbi:hypothetical protein [Streptomyces sp. KR80]|uniref:hypothetical protein n=1 Tax=Streptomyces sp. KR80 TaxID=3457426 RepID=UPI003FD2977F
MTSTDKGELDGEQLELRSQTATPEERRDLVEERKRPLSPRQARRIRIAVAAVFMAAAAIALVVRLSEQSSVLTVGVYGVALILCGVVIELSRRGRTRLGMWLLVAGLGAVAVADQLLRSAH